MTGRMHWWLTTCALGAMACARGANDAAPAAPVAADSAAVTRAREAANALGKDLQGLLFGQLEKGGPVTAIAFCADSAQARTARHASSGVYVRRVSLKVRNPANTPDAVERTTLEALAAQYASGTLPAELVEVRGGGADRQVHYIRPILVQEKCLSCHGDPALIDPAVKQVLTTRYPVDAAVGYRAGDLRGAISVRVPAPE
ncbi:MAG TPA: DUF3365 domain-containing protein [Gemmatimonadales bacterium]|nr:DUF3365 domain-containing protein [Gemmatimonadales bacterium]